MFSKNTFICFALCLYLDFVLSQDNITYTRTPIVLWHGMGDSCCSGLGLFKKYLQIALPGVYVLSLKIGSSEEDGRWNSFFLHPNKQIDIACDIVTSDSRLNNGFNAIGFSQGSQFLRGLVQRCKGAKVKNLISLGGQHQGVFGIPNCPAFLLFICNQLRKLFYLLAYSRWAQNRLVQATFWHDPIHEIEYVKGSTFLADINNEGTINNKYIERLTALENFIMVRFEKDTMVVPVDSQWFGFYKTGQAEQIISLNESNIYINDRLGLRTMDTQNKLHFLSVPGNHLQFDHDWFKENIVDKFLI